MNMHVRLIAMAIELALFCYGFRVMRAVVDKKQPDWMGAIAILSIYASGIIYGCMLCN